MKKQEFRLEDFVDRFRVLTEEAYFRNGVVLTTIIYDTKPLDLTDKKPVAILTRETFSYDGASKLHSELLTDIQTNFKTYDSMGEQLKEEALRAKIAYQQHLSEEHGTWCGH